MPEAESYKAMYAGLRPTKVIETDEESGLAPSDEEDTHAIEENLRFLPTHLNGEEVLKYIRTSSSGSLYRANESCTIAHSTRGLAYRLSKSLDDKDGERSLPWRETITAIFEADGWIAVELPQDPEKLPPQDFKEETYGAAIVAIFKDAVRMAEGKIVRPKMRMARMFLTLLLLWFAIGLQALLIWNIKRFITARYVHDVRIAYDAYERVMYGDDHITLSVNGKARGIGGEKGPYYQLSKFDSGELSSSDKFSICSIPFTQPYFFKAVLLVWTLICVEDLRTSFDLFTQLIWYLPTSTTMEGALKDIDDPAIDSHNHQEVYIASATQPLKAIIFFFIILPRCLVTLCMLSLGCRWLMASNNFEYLVLNSVALAFILELPSLIYRATFPNRVKRDISYTKMDRSNLSEEPNMMNFVVPFSWWGLAIAWMLLYFHVLQAVLPGYQFDVHDACHKYNLERYADNSSFFEWR
jgi:hypothetical protein